MPTVENHSQNTITDKNTAAQNVPTKHTEKNTAYETCDTTTDTEKESTKQKSVPGP